MTAATLVLEPIFEADLPPEQYAYRPWRNAQQAAVEVEELLFRGHRDVVDADLTDFFGSIPHAELMKSVARRVVDRRVLHLIKMWLEGPVEETDDQGRKRRTTEARDNGRGIPQGSPLSPLLANLYMRRFVLGWKKLGLEQRLGSRIVTYADDLVILCRPVSFVLDGFEGGDFMNWWAIISALLALNTLVRSTRAFAASSADDWITINKDYSTKQNSLDLMQDIERRSLYG